MLTRTDPELALTRKQTILAGANPEDLTFQAGKPVLAPVRTLTCWVDLYSQRSPILEVVVWESS